MPPIISVENLSKRYLVGHQSSSRERYTALRDVLARQARSFVRRTGDILRGRQIVQGDEVEEFWALRNVSFDVKEGEVVGIIGRNGAGKSTLLKILCRITEPTTGRIILRGRVASLLEVGTGFHQELTGRENIFLNGAVLGMNRREIRCKFDEIVAFSGVDNFLDTPVKRYSTGMYVRLAFAVAAHLEPEILVVDEVLAVGDAEFQRKCLGKMKDVAAGGRTVLFVSHQLGMLRDLCTQGILLESGKVKLVDSIESTLSKYLEPKSLALSPSNANNRYLVDVQINTPDTGGSHVFYGDPVKIRARLNSLPEHASAFTVAINDIHGRRLSLFSTEPHDGVVLPLGCPLDLEFQIDFCPYAPGEYLLDVAVTEPNVRVVEEVVGALKFEVLPARRGGTMAYGAPFGQYFPQHKWRVMNS